MQGYPFHKRQKNRRWAKWKNILMIVIYIAAVCGIIIGAVYLYPILSAPELKMPDEDVCVTENCLKAALHIVSSIDLSQDPCYDFYQFTCGNFINKVYERNSPSLYHAQKLNIANKLNAVIAEPITGQEEGLYLQQKRFYQSCMDVAAIDEEGLEPLEKLLEELGGWPVVKGQSWIEEGFELNKVIIKCMELGLPFQWFFEMTFNENWLGIHQPIITNEYDSYKESAYLKLMVQTAVNLGANTLAVDYMKEVLNFEKNLETIASQEGHNIIPLPELNSTFYMTPWLEFVNTIIENYTFFEENDTIIILNQEYVKQLNLLLSGTPKRVQADFIIWKIIQVFGLYLPMPIRDNFTNFMVPEEQQMNTRFKICVADSINRFPRIAEAEFIRRYIDDDKIETVKDMISNIKKQFINRLNAADWIDESTKETGINKLTHIVEIIAQHSLDFDENIVNEFLKLSDLEFLTSNIIDMIRQRNKDVFMKKLDVENTTQIDYFTNFFFSKTFNVNAAYMETQNVIFLPAGIIQDIFIDSSRPNYLNYGALGSIIGHEIAHAFGPNANTHDSQEEEEIITAWFNSTPQAIADILFLNTTHLWKNDSLEELNSRMDCINRDLADTENDETIVAENFADLIGVDIAYEAYSAWAEQYEKEQQLPGLPFSPKQLFWIQFGAVNCYRHIDNVPWTYDKNTHAGMRYRVLNILKNSENFARDFECPEASVMNPKEKCRVF